VPEEVELDRIRNLCWKCRGRGKIDVMFIEQIHFVGDRYSTSIEKPGSIECDMCNGTGDLRGAQTELEY
jgi:hypothetical protein